MPSSEQISPKVYPEVSVASLIEREYAPAVDVAELAAAHVQNLLQKQRGRHGANYFVPTPPNILN